MKLLTAGTAALLSLCSAVAAEPQDLETESVKIIEGDRVDIYEHRDKQGRNRVDVDPKRTMPYSFVGGEIGDEGIRPSGDPREGRDQMMWSIKKW